MAVLNQFRNEKFCCRSPAIKIVNSFYTCTNCGTVIGRNFENNQNYNRIGTISKETQFTRKSKQNSLLNCLNSKQRYYTRVEKFLLSYPGLERSLDLYRSIPDKRCLSGYPTRVIAAALGIVACEKEIVKNEVFGLQEIYLIIHAVRKIEDLTFLNSSNLPHENFMYQILTAIQMKDGDKRTALKIFRDYYEQLLINYDRQKRLEKFIFLTKNLVIPKNFAFWVKIASKIIETPIPVILQKHDISVNIVSYFAQKISRFLQSKIPLLRNVFLIKFARLIKNVATKINDNRNCAFGNRYNCIRDYQEKRRSEKCSRQIAREKNSENQFPVCFQNGSLTGRWNNCFKENTLSKNKEVLSKC
ncbi:MAG: hypothetical protein ACTSX4_13400 [Candidatus Helarchaeota archaeon]